MASDGGDAAGLAAAAVHGFLVAARLAAAGSATPRFHHARRAATAALG